jgi:hypothetical protein
LMLPARRNNDVIGQSSVADVLTPPKTYKNTAV